MRGLYDHSGVEEDEEEDEEETNDSNNNDSMPGIESDDYPSRPRISADVKYDKLFYL